MNNINGRYKYRINLKKLKYSNLVDSKINMSDFIIIDYNKYLL